MTKKAIEHIALGHTKSGKPIFDSWLQSATYLSYTEEDHMDANNFHFERWEKKWDELEAKYGTTYKARAKFENNRELTRLEELWSHHSKMANEFRVSREKLEKKERRLAKSKIVLSKHEQLLKESKAAEAKEFREKKKNLSDEDKHKIILLEAKLQRLKACHPQDCPYNFGVSASEERRNARNKIKSIINKTVNHGTN